MPGLCAGELGSLEEVVGQMLQHRPPLLPESVLDAVWSACKQAHGSRESSGSARILRCSLILLSMAAAKKPETVAQNLQTLLEVHRILLTMLLHIRRLVIFTNETPVQRRHWPEAVTVEDA